MSKFPEGKRFAFSVFDDTDSSLVTNVAPVYRFLSELGFRTTKSVWPLATVPGGRIGGSTLQEPEYLEFVKALQQDGFEIALHNVQNHDAQRDRIKRGMEEFQRLIGAPPRVHANHSYNRDNIYWGAARLSRITSKLWYDAATRFRRGHMFEGHDPASNYFWGDICRENITYVRNFVFEEINLERIHSTLPYHDPAKPFVNYWFSSCEGGNVRKFCDTLCARNQERLEAEGGVCIAYTHFAAGFYEHGNLNPAFVTLMRQLANRNGWFVPVSELLDYLRRHQANSVISRRELAVIERHWILHKLRVGYS